MLKKSNDIYYYSTSYVLYTNTHTHMHTFCVCAFICIKVTYVCTYNRTYNIYYSAVQFYIILSPHNSIMWNSFCARAFCVCVCVCALYVCQCEVLLLQIINEWNDKRKSYRDHTILDCFSISNNHTDRLSYELFWHGRRIEKFLIRNCRNDPLSQSEQYRGVYICVACIVLMCLYHFYFAPMCVLLYLVNVKREKGPRLLAAYTWFAAVDFFRFFFLNIYFGLYVCVGCVCVFYLILFWLRSAFESCWIWDMKTLIICIFCMVLHSLLPNQLFLYLGRSFVLSVSPWARRRKMKPTTTQPPPPPALTIDINASAASSQSLLLTSIVYVDATIEISLDTHTLTYVQ